MKRVLNLVIGGLQNKIFNLVLVTILLIVAAYTAVIVYQTSNLQTLVMETGAKQSESIEEISNRSMDAVATDSLGRTTELEASIADNFFRAAAEDVTMLAKYAEHLFSESKSYPARTVAFPDAARDGVVSVQLMLDENVDIADPEIAAEIALLGNMTDVMSTLYEESSINACYIATPSGVFVIADDRPGTKFSDSGELLTLPARSRPWYTGAVETGGLYFSDVQQDILTDQLGVFCSCPVYVDGALAAVVGADLFLDKITQGVTAASDVSEGFRCIINQNGHVVFAPDNQWIFRVQEDGIAQDMRRSPEHELGEFVTDALSGVEDVRIVNVFGKDYYMASAQLDTVGWAIVSVVRQKVVMQPTVILHEQYDAITQEAMASYEQSSSASLRTIITLLLTGTLLALIASQMLARRIVKPLELITKRINSLSGSDNAFEMEDTYRTGDEIEILAQSFATLSQRTRTYITQITQITAEKERIGAELDMAASIQANALPNIFPAFPGRKEFDIYATMHPAKEVGGDFYDFFMIGDDHLGIVVADVSGKGVPAALFMMIAKTMLKTQAQTRLSPERVLLEVNAALTEGNDEDMFVTVWLGVLEISTGELTYADAGHEKLLLYQNGEWKFLPKAGGPALAMWEPEDLELMDEKYQFRNQTVKLNPGDAIFQYTDGVTEATDADNQLFGDDRLLAAMNGAPSAKPEELLPHVRAKIDEFVKDAPQFDDITMLGLRMN